MERPNLTWFAGIENVSDGQLIQDFGVLDEFEEFKQESKLFIKDHLPQFEDKTIEEMLDGMRDDEIEFVDNCCWEEKLVSFFKDLLRETKSPRDM